MDKIIFDTCKNSPYVSFANIDGADIYGNYREITTCFVNFIASMIERNKLRDMQIVNWEEVAIVLMHEDIFAFFDLQSLKLCKIVIECSVNSNGFPRNVFDELSKYVEIDRIVYV